MAKTYEVVMVRHGESEWNQANKFCGWFDAELSEKGRCCLFSLLCYIKLFLSYLKLSNRNKIDQLKLCSCFEQIVIKALKESFLCLPLKLSRRCLLYSFMFEEFGKVKQVENVCCLNFQLCCFCKNELQNKELLKVSCKVVVANTYQAGMPTDLQRCIYANFNNQKISSEMVLVKCQYLSLKFRLRN